MMENQHIHSRMVDMTKGNPTKLLLAFSLPLLLGNLFQQMYNLVDSVVVGRFVGAGALAAVGTCGAFNFLFFSLASGLSAGIGVLISQQYGAGNHDAVRRIIANSVYILGIPVLLVSVIGVALARPLLVLLQTPEDLLGLASTYLMTTCAGMAAIAAYNGLASILRALGDSKTPLYFLVVSCVVNIALDLALVLGFRLGVFGVALATIIAQAVSAIGCLLYARRYVPMFSIKREERTPDKGIILRSFELGVPLALQSSLIAVSCIILQGAVNTFGESVMAAFTVTSRIEQLVQQPYGSLAFAITTFTGQNIGAGKIDRVKSGFHRSVAMTLIFSLCMLPLAYGLGEQIVRIFVADPAVVQLGATALRITGICYFPLGLIYMPRALMNGAGDARFAMINGLTEVTCRILYSQVLTRIPVLGYWGIWITSGATWITTAIVCLLRYRSGIWENRALVDAMYRK